MDDATTTLDLGALGVVRIPHNEYWPDQMADVLQHIVGHVKRPRWIPFLKNLDSIAEIPVEINGVKVRIPIKVREWTHDRRVEWIAHHWLRPFENGVIGRDLFAGLVQIAGLGHLDDKKVLDEVRVVCQRIGIEHPRLFRWVQVRLAELSLLTETAVLPAARWRANEVRLRRKLVVLSGVLWGPDLTKALAAAEELCIESLRFAYTAAHQLLRPRYARSENDDASKPRLHASLMVPVRRLDAVKTALADGGPELQQISRRAFDAADELWKDYPPEAERFLVLVAETIRPRRHTGFWVPVSETATLPGAADAFLNGRPYTVAKKRIPTLGMQPLSGRWATYVRERVHGSFFVSVPVFADDDASGQRSPVAVVNVNVGTPDDRVWERALHPGWLEAVTSAIAPFAEIAHYSALAWFAALQRAADTKPTPHVVLDTVSPVWNVFPGVLNQLALPPPKDAADDR